VSRTASSNGVEEVPLDDLPLETERGQEFVEPLTGIAPHDVPERGRPPISTIGFGRLSVSSASRVPAPPARITVFTLG